MSNRNNDLLYDRMADILPYLSPWTCQELDILIKTDLDEAQRYLETLEALYADDLRAGLPTYEHEDFRERPNPRKVE